MKELNKKLLITSVFCLGSILSVATASAQDVSYASAGPTGATSYSSQSNYGGLGYLVNGFGSYGYGSYGNSCCGGCGQALTYNACDPCATNYGCGSSILQSIPVITTLSSPCSGTNSLGFGGFGIFSNGHNRHHIFGW